MDGGWWKWALLSPDGVAPSRTVDVSASVNLPLHHKVHKFSSGTGSPGWSRKKGRKTVVVVYDLQKCLTQTWVDFEQNVIEAAIDQWRDSLRSCRLCMLVADTLNTCCEIIVYLYYAVHQNIL